MRKLQWKEYEAIAPRKRPNDIRATLSSKGSFVFDLGTYEKMNQPEAMTLLFDKDARVIGLKPATADKPNAVMVRQRCDRTNMIITCINFLRTHRITITRTITFPQARLEDGILVLDLRNTMEYVTYSKPRKRR